MLPVLYGGESVSAHERKREPHENTACEKSAECAGERRRHDVEGESKDELVYTLRSACEGISSAAHAPRLYHLLKKYAILCETWAGLSTVSANGPWKHAGFGQTKEQSDGDETAVGRYEGSAERDETESDGENGNLRALQQVVARHGIDTPICPVPSTCKKLETGSQRGCRSTKGELGPPEQRLS